MSTPTQPLETLYAGWRFRSRLETFSAAAEASTLRKERGVYSILMWVRLNGTPGSAQQNIFTIDNNAVGNLHADRVYIENGSSVLSVRVCTAILAGLPHTRGDSSPPLPWRLPSEPIWRCGICEPQEFTP